MTRNLTISAAILALTTTGLVSAANNQANNAGDGANQLEDANSAAAQSQEKNPSCQADINGDGMVEVHDLMYVLGNWSHCLSGDPTACISDVNGDGRVNVNDLVAVLEAWGTVCPSTDG